MNDFKKLAEPQTENEERMDCMARSVYSEITPEMEALADLCVKNGKIDPELYAKYDVKRGLRDINGNGVLTGLTDISEIRSSRMENGVKIPCEGQLFYRGYSIEDLVRSMPSDHSFGFEVTAYLLLFGELPNKEQLDGFIKQLSFYRTLPTNFVRDIIMKAPSGDMMNTLARSVLTMYSYDDAPDDISIPNVLRQCIQLIAIFPLLSVYGYQAYRHYHDGKSLYIHQPKPEFTTAENILRILRSDKQFTPLEAKVLDIALMLHAEHGGGNNSTFVCRALSSSGTDTYSAIAGAVGSLKGPLHGGANAKVMEMFHYIQENVDPHDDGSIRDYLVRLLDGEAGDRSGKLYGLGHAVYTMSDPRAVLLKKYARHMAQIKGYEAEFDLLQKVEELGIPLVQERRHSDTPMCANVDMYSGLVYTMLDIPEDVFTPLFASARIAGWCANRMEEVITGHRIMRPAYRAVTIRGHYVPMEERTSRIKEFDL